MEKTERENTGASEKILIRPFEKKDTEAVYNIIKETFFRPWTIEEILLENVFSYKVVLEKDSVVIGFLFGEIIFEEANILMIAISKEHQGRGFGKALLESFIKKAKEKGVKKIFLEVSTKNESALKLYKKTSFKIFSKREKYYRNGEDAFVMVLEIK